MTTIEREIKRREHVYDLLHAAEAVLRQMPLARASIAVRLQEATEAVRADLTGEVQEALGLTGGPHG